MARRHPGRSRGGGRCAAGDPAAGWRLAQLPDRENDAYATGLALDALDQGGGVPVTDPAERRGVALLLDTQGAKGTWFVRKRTLDYNKYFDAGFPYGKDQFISLPGSCWATMSLALGIEPPK
jgi:hypothetical protein